MIRYALSCANDHGFDSWFQSAEAFDRLVGAGMVGCTVCGSTEVVKSLMAPTVHPGRKAAAKAPDMESGASRAGGAGAGALSADRSPVEQALAEMRRQVEENSDYVGMNFAAEARAIHDGEAPERSIYGEAKPDEARALIEDGVPVAPLPFMPGRKVN